jgi:hypothetical protein
MHAQGGRRFHAPLHRQPAQTADEPVKLDHNLLRLLKKPLKIQAEDLIFPPRSADEQ